MNKEQELEYIYLKLKNEATDSELIHLINEYGMMEFFKDYNQLIENSNIIIDDKYEALYKMLAVYFGW